MFLGAYHFDGDPTALIAAYEGLMASFPPDAIVFHVCIVRDEGITVFDACPTRAVFAHFSVGYEFNAALAEARLPSPRVELLGDVHASRVRSGEAR
jgi:hypothetical protein